jgi:hypothetical protein
MASPTFVATVSKTSQTSPISSTTLLAFGTSAGLYHVKGVLTYTSGSSPGLVVGFSWSDPISQHNCSEYHFGSKLGAQTNEFFEIDQVINSDGNGVNYVVDLIGSGSCPSYGLALTVEQLF